MLRQIVSNISLLFFKCNISFSGDKIKSTDDQRESTHRTTYIKPTQYCNLNSGSYDYSDVTDNLCGTEESPSNSNATLSDSDTKQKIDESEICESNSVNDSNISSSSEIIEESRALYAESTDDSNYSMFSSHNSSFTNNFSAQLFTSRKLFKKPDGQFRRNPIKYGNNKRGRPKSIQNERFASELPYTFTAKPPPPPYSSIKYENDVYNLPSCTNLHLYDFQENARYVF